MNKNTKKIVGAMATAALLYAPYVPAQMSGDSVKIGFITDLSGLYADIDGTGGVEAIKMAIADFGGKVNGKKIELLTADHQNKPDKNQHHFYLPRNKLGLHNTEEIFL